MMIAPLTRQCKSVLCEVISCRWCDLRTTPSIEELHPVFDSKLTVNGEQFSLNGNAISYDSELIGELAQFGTVTLQSPGH